MKTVSSSLSAQLKILALDLGHFFNLIALFQITLVSYNFSAVPKSGSGGTQIDAPGTNTYHQLAFTWSYNNVVTNSGVLSYPTAAWSTGYIQFFNRSR